MLNKIKGYLLVLAITSMFALGLNPAVAQSSTQIETSVMIWTSTGIFSNTVFNQDNLIASNGFLYSGTMPVLTNFYSWRNITTDLGNASAASSNDTLSIQGGDTNYINTSMSVNAIQIQPGYKMKTAVDWVGDSSNVVSSVMSLAGVNVTVGTVTNLFVTPGYVVDTAGRARISLTNTVYVSLNASGAGGIDSGTKLSNRWYYIYAIATTNSLTNSVTISTNPVAPVYVDGYMYSRLIGHARTTAGTNFLRSIQFGANVTKITEYLENRTVAPLKVLTAGAATTFTAVDASSVVPPRSRMIFGSGSTVYGSAASYTYVATRSYTNLTIGVITINSGKGFTSSGTYQIANEDQTLFYYVSSATASADIDINGYAFDY